MNSFETADVSEGVGSKLLIVGGITALAVEAAVRYTSKTERDPCLKAASLLPYCEDIALVMADYDYALVGGLPIDAINHDETVLMPETKEILVSDAFDKPLFRPNKSICDNDILVYDKDENGRLQAISDEEKIDIKQQLIAKAAERAKRENQPYPEMTVFSFDNETSLVHTATMLTEDGEVVLRQGYAEQRLPEDAMETWDLVFPNGVRVKVLNPWEQYGRSMVRFCSGMKTKDSEKLGRMAKKLRETPGLGDIESGELYNAYSQYHDAMLEGNSFAAVLTEIQSNDREWNKVGRLGVLALARTIMGAGEKNKFVSTVVQRAPVIFNHFVGGK